MIHTSEIELCFWDPTRGLPPGKERGVLYLLRRDLTELYGDAAQIPSQTHKSPMLASIGMMTGLDLMSKLATNELNEGRAGFKRFLEHYGKLSSQDAETFYKLRCAQTHAYCLIDIDEKRNYEAWFTLIDDRPDSPLIEKVSTRERDGYRIDTYHVNYWELKRFFLLCVSNFEKAIREGTNPLLTYFMLAMARIGKLEVSQV